MSRNNRNIRKYPMPQIAWGIYNFGRLIGVEYLRKTAVCEVERHTGQPWSKARKYMEVHKVRVEKIDREAKS